MNLPAPLTEVLLRLAPVLLILVLHIATVASILRAQRKARAALLELAPNLGWTSIRRPHLSNDAVRGMWGGRVAALGWIPGQRNSPSRVTAGIDLARPGGFILRARSAKEGFLSRPVVLFAPPKVEFFDPADAARYRAWSTDRSLVDSLLAIPGIRESLDANLAGGGVLTLRKGRLKIHRPLAGAAPARGWRSLRLALRQGPDPDRVRALAAEEWALLVKIAG